MLKCHLNSSVVTLLWSTSLILFLLTLQVKGVFSPISPCPSDINPLSFALPCSDLYWQDTNDGCAKVFEVWGVVDPKYIPCCVLSKLTVIQLNHAQTCYSI